jgi:hypothetical protein
MIMATQGERQDNFTWRPNDYSSTTLTRYDQEAKHWVRAFKNAESKNKGTSINETFGVIGLVFSLVFSIIALIALSIGYFIKWLKSL